MRDQEADYILAVKQNQPTLQAAVQETFALARAEAPATVPSSYGEHKTVHKGHGRIEIRHCRAIGDPDILAYVDPQGQWPARQSLIEVESVCRQGAQSTIQTRHFISRGLPRGAGAADHPPGPLGH